MWFSEMTAGWIGGIVGGVGGTLAGLLGAMAGIFAPRGKFKGLVINSMRVFIVLGVLCLIIAVVALIDKQPYHVWYPFCLMGLIVTTVMLSCYIGVKQTYTRVEMKKMHVDDLGQ